MGRITARWPITKVAVAQSTDTRVDTLAVEEPLEIRVGGSPLVVTMRTPGDDVDLAAGFFVSEGVIARRDQFRSAIACGGPGTGGDTNTYNVLDVTLAADTELPARSRARSFTMTSACGVCGKSEIDEVTTVSAFDASDDRPVVSAEWLATLPDVLRSRQTAFAKTGGLHAAALFDADSGDLLVLREDVGRYNAVDKVVGWALREDRLPLRRTVLAVSGRASFELVQKAVMAGVPMLAAVSAPSSLAVELARESGVSLIGFLRGATMNVYTRPDRVVNPIPVSSGALS